MTYNEKKGNIFNSKSIALINTVNCYGVMGKGIALEFRRRFPKMYAQYVKDCEDKKYHPGDIYFYNERNKTIINCAIKDHWKYPSKIQWVESCLIKFTQEYIMRKIPSVSFPLMGTTSGNLPVCEIKQLMRAYLQPLKDISIEVYDFSAEESDSLFELLKEIASKNKIQEFHKISGMRIDLIKKLFKAVNDEVVISLYSITLNKIIGAKSIDKVYETLLFFEEHPNSQFQPTLLGD